MITFHRGDYYCLQCGESYDSHVTECRFCSGDISKDYEEVLPPVDDFDQLTEDEINEIMYSEIPF